MNYINIVHVHTYVTCNINIYMDGWSNAIHNSCLDILMIHMIFTQSFAEREMLFVLWDDLIDSDRLRVVQGQAHEKFIL